MDLFVFNLVEEFNELSILHLLSWKIWYICLTFFRLRPAKAAQSQQKGPVLFLLLLLLLLLLLQDILCLSALTRCVCAHLERSAAA